MVGERGQRLVIVNLQTTPMDHLCSLRIFAKTDQVREGGKIIFHLASVAMCVCR